MPKVVKPDPGEFRGLKPGWKCICAMLLYLIGSPASFGKTRSSSFWGQAGFHFRSIFSTLGAGSILRLEALKLARRHSEIEEVWLFGSLARGQAVPGSDADVLLVLRECDLPFLERAVHFQPEFCGVGVDLFAYTRKELEQMEGSGHQFLERVKTEMTCLFKRRNKRRGHGAESS